MVVANFTAEGRISVSPGGVSITMCSKSAGAKGDWEPMIETPSAPVRKGRSGHIADHSDADP
jgi:hypothetical protein